MQPFRSWYLVFVLVCASLPLLAQNAAAPGGGAVRQITLGHSVVALTGPWKFHIGDNPRWADPNFDDSQWETVDLGAKAESIDPLMGTGGYSPGWTAKGHPGYSGFAWYRMRIRITGADGPLAMLSPTSFDDGYQIFAGGRRIASFGDFDRPVPTVYGEFPAMFPVPESAIHPGPDAASSGNSDGAGDGSMVLAFRFYMAPATLLQPTPGGLHTPPVLGLASAVTASYHVAWEEEYRATLSIAAMGILYLGFALLVLMLYAFDRTETILLWPVAACLLAALANGVNVLAGNTQALTALQGNVLMFVCGSLSNGLWLMTWWTYFGLRERKWIRNTIGVLVLWSIANLVLFQILMFRDSASHAVFAAQTISQFGRQAAYVVLMILIAYFGWRRPQRESWILFLALFFYALRFLPFDLLHIQTVWFPFGIAFSLYQASELAMLFCFSFVLLRHFRSSQRRQQAMEEDVAQAQQVQQVLIPEELPPVPGLTIESEYRPAREVGGDFFQILPNDADGSVLVVVGDVTGHGLQAGMLVALIVGAIRSTAEMNADPLFVLEALNRRLIGRGQAHATGLALRITAEGDVTLANAGHMPPYLNGKEFPMEGALPLGMVESAEFPVMHFRLAPGDTLMLLSDGVAEAQDAQGHLFGFERIEAMLRQPITAAEVATVAQEFGQQDDISVMRVVRAAKVAERTEAEPALAAG